ERALDELIAPAVKARYASTPRPRPPAAVVGPRNESSRPVPADESRYIPAHVKRAVYIRDGGRCAYIGPGSHRCAERALVEFHHVAPYVTGGRATVANIELRCRAHKPTRRRPSLDPLGPMCPAIR